MTLTIGPNISALRVARQLGDSTRALSETFTRLSSGLRINGAKDDAAGLAVSSGLDFKTRVFGRAILNVSDGVSALQIADGAIGQISTLLQRMAELAEQSASGGLSDAQRSVLDKEYQQLDQEIRRITSSTQFNNINLLAGQVNENTAVQGVTNVGAAGVAGELALSGDGRYIAFYDNAAGQLKQINTDTREVRVIATISAPAYLKTDSAGGLVTFESNANLTGQNGVGAEQLYMWNRYSGEIRQLTNGQAGDFIISSNISADGSTVTVTGTTDYQDGGTVWSGAAATFTSNLYAINVGTGKVKAVVEGSAAAIAFQALSPDGNYMTFSSLYNPFGTNADNNAELFIANLSGNTPVIRQMTQTTGVEFPSAVVNNAGEAFWSSAYNLTGQNASLNSQIFKYSFANNSVTQATSNTASGFTIYSLSLSQDGSYLSVVSAKSVFGIGSTAGQSVVRMNTSTFQTETISSLGAGDGYPGLASIYVSADGNSVFGVGNSVTGNNDVLNFRTARNSLNTAIETGSGSSGIINTQIGAINGTLRGLGTLGLSTQYAARGTLETIQDNIQRLSLMQSSIGAGLARLSSADQLLRESVLQFQQAKSRITDIDVAVESANLIREQIRQQSATALLAQAKLQPALILNLLNFN